MSAAERAEFDATYAGTKLALEVGEKVRDARESAGLPQRERRGWARARRR